MSTTAAAAAAAATFGCYLAESQGEYFRGLLQQVFALKSPNQQRESVGKWVVKALNEDNVDCDCETVSVKQSNVVLAVWFTAMMRWLRESARYPMTRSSSSNYSAIIARQVTITGTFHRYFLARVKEQWTASIPFWYFA